MQQVVKCLPKKNMAQISACLSLHINATKKVLFLFTWHIITLSGSSRGVDITDTRRHAVLSGPWRRATRSGPQRSRPSTNRFCNDTCFVISVAEAVTPSTEFEKRLPEWSLRSQTLFYNGILVLLRYTLIFKDGKKDSSYLSFFTFFCLIFIRRYKWLVGSDLFQWSSRCVQSTYLRSLILFWFLSCVNLLLSLKVLEIGTNAASSSSSSSSLF